MHNRELGAKRGAQYSSRSGRVAAKVVEGIYTSISPQNI